MQERDKFVLKSKYQPTGDQPKAIKELVESIRAWLCSLTELLEHTFRYDLV